MSARERDKGSSTSLLGGAGTTLRQSPCVGKHVCFKDTEVLPKLWINVWMSQSINGIVYVWRLGWPGLLRTCSSSGRCASPFFLVSPILGTRRFDGRLVDVSVSSVGCVDVFEVWDM